MMLLGQVKDTAAAKCVAAVHKCVSAVPPDDVPREERIKARLRELTEDSRRLRAELEQLIRYQPNRHRSMAHDRPKKLQPADRRRKPR
jgi:hypothetical protein